MEQYDVVIVGSGLGGLACGTILAKEGFRVCVVEKNKQIGGTLQTFVRDKVIFDSGVHYVGGLDKGQNLHQFFTYLGIMDKLKIKKMDEDCFDAFLFEGDPVVYKYAQGYDAFKRELIAYFPEEESAIDKYCEAIRQVCKMFPLYNLHGGQFEDKMGALHMDAKSYLESLTSNVKLQNVLAANNLLYAGVANKTPFYVLALVVNSYIESSWRFLDGGSQIAKYLSREITSRGGVIKKNKVVTHFVDEDGEISHLEVRGGERIYGKKFISNIHPQQTLEMVQSDKLKKAYRKRIQSLKNSVSVFYINVVFKPDTFKYRNFNYYYFAQNDVWRIAEYTQEDWPKGYAMFFTSSAKDNEYAQGVTLMTYMEYEDVRKWEETFNTVSEEASRGEDYDEFKRRYSEKLFDLVERKFPGFRNCIKSHHVATPLTMRDYLGTADGSLYGVEKDYQEPLRTFISPRTKIPNLYLTGQNLNLHGVLGVTVSAVVTCSEILGQEYLIQKIRNA